MAILPVRDLGSAGVITDTAPYNIPINAFSTGINVRFDEGKVRRAPIFRKVKDSLGFTPRFAFGITPTLWSWSLTTTPFMSTPAGWCRTDLAP